ncbi:hypothetical protein U1Q18_013433 [Sarracenia purpurea var. burkii]
MGLFKYSMLLFLLLVIDFTCQGPRFTEARPLSFPPQQRFSKIFATLGMEGKKHGFVQVFYASLFASSDRFHMPRTKIYRSPPILFPTSTKILEDICNTRNGNLVEREEGNKETPVDDMDRRPQTERVGRELETRPTNQATAMEGREKWTIGLPSTLAIETTYVFIKGSSRLEALEREIPKEIWRL